MRDQQKIYIQNASTCVRNSDILNVNMSSDICTFTSPIFNVTGATKIIDDTKTTNISGFTYDDIILSAISNCYAYNCFEGLTWDLEINEDGVQAYSANVVTTTNSASTITQDQINNAFIDGLNTLGYDYTYTGSSFTIQKPYGVETLTIDLCLGLTLDDSCTGYTCPSGYTINPTGEKCVYTAITSATYSGSGSTITAGDNTTFYGEKGSRFYEDITNKPFPIVRISDIPQIYDNDTNEVTYVSTVISSFWGDGSYPYTGRLNNIGVKGNPQDEWHGFSQCYEFDESTTYYIGLAADNYCRLKINGELIIDFTKPVGWNNFQYWHVFPYKFEAGPNIIEMEGLNIDCCSAHSFGFELYSASTVAELTAATNTTEAKSFWDTSMKIGGTYDLGETVGYQCPDGYALDLCSASATCTQILYTGVTGGGLSGGCVDLCVELFENTYDILTTGDTGVYIINTATTIDLGFQFTANTDSFIDNDATFKFEVFKFNENNSTFYNSPVYTSEEMLYSSFSGTSAFTESIPVSALTLDGEYLIKGYYVFDFCTEFFDRLNVENNTLSKNGERFGLYRKAIDYYFVAMYSADTPIFSYGDTYPNLGNLIGFSIFPEISGQTAFTISQGFVGSPIVALNGLTLVENSDYVLNDSANTLTISAGTELDDVITVILVSDGTESLGFTNDLIIVDSPITSGVTNGQGSNSIYYNTTQGKYEIYTTVIPNSFDDLIVTLNGFTLAPNIDYYQSISNKNRVILEGDVVITDVINIYYNSRAQYIGDIFVNTPTIYWNITNPPANNNGLFTVEVANAGDTQFTSLITTATTSYIENQTNYSAQITVSGNVGTEYIYRIKNEKRFTTLVGDVITNVNYSETIPIQIQSNAINSY